MSGKRRPNRPRNHPAAHPEDPAHPDHAEWQAEHPASPPPGQPPDWTDLAPYASTGGFNQYSPMGQVVQETNFTKGLLRNRHWYNRAIGWVILIGLVASVAGLGLWRLITLFT
jgi:hypothetical protein